MNEAPSRRRWILLGIGLLLVILVPFFLAEEPIARWTGQIIRSGDSRGVIGASLAALLALDIVLPVPSTVVSTACGALLGLGPGALASWAGMTAGCLVGYALGSRAGRGAARRLVGAAELTRVSTASARWGDGMILLFRAVPVLAEASVIFAGMTGMPFRRFLLLTAASNGGISLVYAAVGALSAKAESFLLAFVGAILVPLIAMTAARRFSSA